MRQADLERRRESAEDDYRAEAERHRELEAQVSELEQDIAETRVRTAELQATEDRLESRVAQLTGADDRAQACLADVQDYLRRLREANSRVVTAPLPRLPQTQEGQKVTRVLIDAKEHANAENRQIDEDLDKIYELARIWGSYVLTEKAIDKIKEPLLDALRRSRYRGLVPVIEWGLALNSAREFLEKLIESKEVVEKRHG
ncbi:hypothetical protein [Asticcacaulis solisilvae]|uniref:hypothetical protein n=1 Tax=Asticcacaulis solisilvae TaxID=1217274 RepID=UPI003FD7F28B